MILVKLAATDMLGLVACALAAAYNDFNHWDTVTSVIQWASGVLFAGLIIFAAVGIWSHT